MTMFNHGFTRLFPYIPRHIQVFISIDILGICYFCPYCADLMDYLIIHTAKINPELNKIVSGEGVKMVASNLQRVQEKRNA